MKSIFFIFSFIFVSNSFALNWPPSVIEKYSKEKKLSDLNILKPKIASEDAQTIKIGYRSGFIRLKRGESPTVFFFNGHLIELKDVQTGNDLKDSLRKSLPRKSSWFHLIIKPAVAEDDIDKAAIEAANFLIKKTNEVESCNDLIEFTNICNEKALFILNEFNDGGRVASGDESQKMEREQKVVAINKLIKKLESLNAIIENKAIPFQLTNVKTCSVYNPYLENDFAICRGTLKDYEYLLGKINDVIRLRQINESIDSYQEKPQKKSIKQTPKQENKTAK